MAPFKKTRSLEKPQAASSSSAAAAAVVDDFSARRSSRVAAGRYAADNDTWVEALAVCEIPVKPGYGDDKAAAASKRPGGGGLFRKFKSSKSMSDKEDDANGRSQSSSPGEDDVAAASQRLTLRPYFQSRNTGQRVWDEPPSGASEILYATPEARRMAQAQLEEMKGTYAAAAVKRRREREEQKTLEAALLTSGSKKESGSGGSKKLIPKSFRRSSSASAAVDASQSSSLLGNRNKSSRRVRGTLDEGGRKGIPKSIIHESKELAGVDDDDEFKSSYEQDLQKAMLMSMGIGGGSVMGVGDHKPRSRSSPDNSFPASCGNSVMTREEEEQLALAKALSASEQEARQGKSTRRSKSSSHRRGGSNSSSKGSDRSGGSGGSGRQRRSRSHNRGPHRGDYEIMKSPPNMKSPPVSTDEYNSYANAKPPSVLGDEFDEGFDGGGKIPATRSEGRKGDLLDCYEKPTNDADFGDRGASWELSWSHSASPTGKDWAMS